MTVWMEIKQNHVKKIEQQHKINKPKKNSREEWNSMQFEAEQSVCCLQVQFITIKCYRSTNIYIYIYIDASHTINMYAMEHIHQFPWNKQHSIHKWFQFDTSLFQIQHKQQQHPTKEKLFIWSVNIACYVWVSSGTTSATFNFEVNNIRLRVVCDKSAPKKIFE